MKRIYLLLLAGILCLVTLVGCTSKQTSEGNQQETNTTKMRIASWNIDSKANPDIKEMSNIIKELKIEIMGFQEIDILNSRNDYDMAQDFVNENYPYVHFAKGRDFADGYFGVGTTSAYEFKEISSIPIESTGSRATKTLERVLVEKEGKEIAFYVTHTSWENNDLRRRQFTEILERVEQDQAEYKIIVADFNADQSLYEYDIFKDNYNIANGKDGVWFDTFNKEDDSMKVMTVDNIITTKNINITEVGTYHSPMADHDLIWADIELLDEAAVYIEHDRALGQGITTNSADNGTNAYNMIDNDDATIWESQADKEEIVLSLDRVYKAKELKIQWGKTIPTKYTVETSINGIDYSDVITADQNTNEIKLNGEVKYIKIKLDEKNENDSYQVATLQLFADWIEETITSDSNLLENGEMDSEGGWIIEDLTAEGNAIYDVSYDKTEANNSIKITKTGSDDGDGLISQTVKVQPNERYQLSFDHKTDTLKSGSFRYEIEQFDKDGNSIATHHAKLTDNLNMSLEFRTFNYNFMTSSTTDSIKVSLHVLSAEGNLWIDNVHIKEVIPTENIIINSDKTVLKVGETAQLSSSILPNSANDINLEWVSLNEGVITIDNAGNITAVAKGKALVGLLSDSDLLAESYILVNVE